MDEYIIMFMIGCNVKTYYNHDQKKWVAKVIEESNLKYSSHFVSFSGSGDSITDAVKDLYINYLDNNSD